MVRLACRSVFLTCRTVYSNTKYTDNHRFKTLTRKRPAVLVFAEEEGLYFHKRTNCNYLIFNILKIVKLQFFPTFVPFLCRLKTPKRLILQHFPTITKTVYLNR